MVYRDVLGYLGLVLHVPRQLAIEVMHRAELGRAHNRILTPVHSII